MSRLIRVIGRIRWYPLRILELGCLLNKLGVDKKSNIFSRNLLTEEFDFAKLYIRRTYGLFLGMVVCLQKRPIFLEQIIQISLQKTKR